MSHMRSYSTLLAHLLGSHDQISGHRERLRRIETRSQLLRWRLLDLAEHPDSCPRYLLDKVLHDNYAVSDRILTRRDVRLVVFVRRPEETLVSIDRLGRLVGDDRYRDPAVNVEYYCDRLDTIVRSAHRAAVRPVVLEAEAVVEQTGAVLSGLTDWLGLETPLSERYTVFPDSGAELLGDPSDAIRLGEVADDPAADRGPEADPPREIPADLLDRATAAYESCRAELARFRLPTLE